jgi:type IV pilus assembly protein PilC
VVAVSNFIKADWYMLIAFGIGGTFGFKRWRKTEHGHRNWDKFKLKLPMKVGDVVLKITMARFSRTFSTLVAAGVDIIRAIEITAQTSGNWKIEDALLDARNKVHEGVPISQPLVENDVFPPMVSQMIKVGEETGELDKMLGKIADFYEEEVDSSIETLTSIIEPIMMIGVGLMVGVIIIAMYMPMFKMLSLVK